MATTQAENQQAKNTYAYGLPSSPRHIRIAVLQPAWTLDAPLVVQLKEVLLDEADNTYIALSYVWGTTGRNRPILCESKTIFVSESCEAALRYLRKHRETVPIWADAICINQDSVDDRNHQVRLMGYIYRRAAFACVWFSIEYKPLFKWIVRTYKAQMFLRSHQQTWRYHYRLAESTTMDPCSWNSEIQKLLVAFRNDPYWTRIWTLQEMTLCKTSILTCGRSQIGIEPLSMISWLWPPRNGALDDDIYAKRKSALDKFNLKGYASQNQGSMAAFSLRSLLSSWKDNDATVPVDMLYGYFGILESFGMKMPTPNYRQEHWAVCVEFSRSIITQYRDLWFLSYKGPDTSPNFPSWCPNWCKRPKTDSLTLDWASRLESFYRVIKSRGVFPEYRLPIADNKLHLETLAMSQGMQLRLQGICISTISIHNATLFSLTPENTAKAEEMVVRATANTQSGLYPEVRLLYEQWAQLALYLDEQEVYCAPLYERATHGLYRDAVVGFIDRATRESGDFSVPPTLEILKHIRIFQANSGHLGISIVEPHDGDVAVLLMGCKWPVLLRPKGRQYEFVGLCWIYEPTTGPPWWQKYETVEEMETFTLV